MNTAITVCELYVRGSEHVPFNAGLLETIRLAYSERRVTFMAEAGHVEEVRAAMSPELAAGVSFATANVPLRDASFLARLRAELPAIWRLRCRWRQTDRRLLVFPTAGPSTLFALSGVLRLSPRAFAGVQVVLHGIANEIIGWRSRNPVMRAIDMRSAIAVCRHPNLRFIVLEESIGAEIVRHKPDMKERVEVLPHPITVNEARAESPARLSQPVGFGFLGVSTTSKGFHYFVEMAAAIRTEFGAEVEFHAIGRLMDDRARFDLDALTTKPATEMLSRAAFRSALAKCHYICLPFTGTHYHLSPSGVLLDAVAACKPFVALRTPVIDAMIRDFGNVGYVCDDIDRMISTIRSIVRAVDQAAYIRQTGAMATLRESRMPANLAPAYRRFTERQMSG